MKQRVVVNKGRKFIVNVPGGTDDGVGPGCPVGVAWLQDETGAWYSVQLTGLSGSLSYLITAIPAESQSVGMNSNDYGFQLLQANDGLPYQVYIDSAGPTLVVSQSVAPFSDTGKPYLFLQSVTDGAYYYVGATSGSGVSLVINHNSRITDGRVPIGGSYLFGGANDRYLFFPSVNNNERFVIGTGSFTVEWYQLMQYQTSFGRVFTLGVWPNAEIGVSIENAAPNANFYLWLDARGNTAATTNSASVRAPYLNQWEHYAVVREEGVNVRIYRNGTPIRTIVDPQYVTSSLSSSARLVIGGEGDNVAATFFSGSITNFHYVVGRALYSQSFTPPTQPIQPTTGTRLLLNATNAATAFSQTTASATLWVPVSPFSFYRPLPLVA